MLLVLRVKTQIMKNISKALNFKDVEVVGLFVKETINAEIVKNLLEKVFIKSGEPNQILTDGGKDLKKGISLLNLKCIRTLDIGHLSANILESIYDKNNEFKKLIKFTSNISLRLRQTIAGWIIPPKLRNKGRYQNISLLAYWVKEVLEYYDNHLEDCDNKTKELLKKNFEGKNFLKNIAKDFYKDCNVINKILEILKNRGFSIEIFNEVMIILSELPMKSKLRIKLENYFKSNIEILKIEKLDNILMSTDIIESVFGKIKYILEKSPVRDFNRTCLLLPALVGSFDQEIITKSLNEIKIKDLKKWQDENIGETLFMKRKKEFSKVRHKKTTSEYAEDYKKDVA